MSPTGSELASQDSREVRVRLGGFCIKGGGHIYTYDPETDGADGCDGWPLFIEVDPEDVHLFPDWVQEAYRWALADLAESESASTGVGEGGVTA